MLIWEWVHRQFPDYKVSMDTSNAILEELQAPINKMLVAGSKNPNVHVTRSGAGKFNLIENESTLLLQVSNFARIFNGKKISNAPITDERLLRDIFLKTVNSDYLFLITQGGRPGDSAKKDIWDSNACKFVLADAPQLTNYQEYDSMWASIKLLRNDYLGLAQEKLEPVILKYNENHQRQITNPYSV